MKRFAGKNALITGGASGIGRATCERFAQKGAVVAFLDRNAEAGNATLAELQKSGATAHFFAVDLLDETALEATFAEACNTLGSLHVLVNNAGVSTHENLDSLTPEAWRQEVDLNLTAHYCLTRLALPELLKTRGSIVNVASVNAVQALGNPAYSAAKAGLVSLTQNVAVECGPQGIRCNAVLPGTIETPVHRHRQAARPDHFERLASWYPLGRVGQPEDVAAAIAFLASEDAAFITGASLMVDGGLTAGSSRMMQDLLKL